MSLERLRVAVVRGGDTPRFDASLRSGEAVLKVLREHEARYAPEDIFVDRAGVWHVRGLPTDPATALRHVDLVWNTSPALHGGERLEQVLGQMKIPHVGSGSLAQALSGSLAHSRELYARAGLPSVRYALLTPEKSSDSDLLYVFRNFMHPVSVRSANGEEGFRARTTRTFAELEEAVRETFALSLGVVVEEYVRGKEALVSVLEKARGERLYTFLPAEIREDKLIAPGNFSPEEKKRLGEAARAAHQALGMRHYSASRFIVTPKRVYILETSAMPEFYTDTPLEKSLTATGWRPRDLVDHLIDLSL